MSRKYILTNTVKDDHIMTVITGFLIQRTTNKKIRKIYISLLWRFLDKFLKINI